MTEAEMRAASTAALQSAHAIHDTATAEKRELTPAEETSYAGFIQDARTHDRSIKRSEEMRALKGSTTAAEPLKTGADADADGTLGLTDEETRKFSFVRLMRALSSPNDKGAQTAAAFELEAAGEAQRKAGKEGGELRGYTIPTEVLRASLLSPEVRALNVATATAGGNTVATNLLGASFIDILRNRLSVMAAGATMLGGLSGNVAIPRQTAAAATAWVTEGNAPGAASQQTFDQVPLTPKTIAVYVDATRRLFLQSSIDVEGFIRGDLAAQMALGIDAAALNGSGTGGVPKGILQTAGIGSVPIGTNGGPMIWDNWVDLETAVAVGNADVGTSTYITNAVQRGRAKKTVQLTNTVGMPIWSGNEVNGYNAIASNQVPSNLTKGSGTNLSAIIFGNFADMLIGMWGGLDLIVDPYTSSTTGTTRFVALQDVDVALRRLASFAATVDAS